MELTINNKSKENQIDLIFALSPWGSRFIHSHFNQMHSLFGFNSLLVYKTIHNCIQNLMLIEEFIFTFLTQNTQHNKSFLTGK